MSSREESQSAERGRSPVEKLAAGVIGSEAARGARAKVLQAGGRAGELQECTLGALTPPSAAVIARLPRRVRSVALRLEGIEDGLDRLEDRLADSDGDDLAKVL